MQGYCVKCKSMKDMKDPRQEKTKKGGNIVKGKCDCGTTICKMGTMEGAKEEAKEEKTEE